MEYQNEEISTRETKENNTQAEDRQEILPELYSKRLILIFALLFSGIFASFLLRSNLRNTGQKKEGNMAVIFIFLMMLLFAAAIEAFSLPPNLTFIGNVIGAAILNEYFWNKYLGRDFEYERKSWGKPVMIALLISLPLMFLLMGSM